MKVSIRSNNCSTEIARKTARQRAFSPLLPTLLAIGAASVLFAKPASGIELGQLQINSTLGQPFSASIAYALNPHEELYSYCVTLKRGFEPGVRSLTHAKVSIANGKILIAGDRPINEPMLAMRVTVNCPYTVKLARDYMVMINPAGSAQYLAQGELALPNVSSTAAATTPPVAIRSAPAAASVPQRPIAVPADRGNETPIHIGDNYRVLNGDTLSKIANRIDSRPVGLWPAIDAIYQANPGAFIGEDKNYLMAGSLLAIPAMSGYEVASDTSHDAALPAPVETVPSASNDEQYATDSSASYQAYDSNSAQWAEEEIAGDYADEYFVSEPEPAALPETAALDEPTLDDDTAVLSSGSAESAADATEFDELVAADEFSAAQPGDVFAGTESSAEISTPTAAVEPIVQPTAPAVERAAPVAVAKPQSDASSATQPWIMWAGGSALALVLVVAFFGRRIRGLFGDDEAERMEPPLDSEGESEITQKSHVLSDVDFPLDETSSGEHAMELDADLGAGFGLQQQQDPEIAFAETTELDLALAASSNADEGMELDADLGAGTGLKEGTDLDVAQDFGFSATDDNATPLDLEIPVEIEVEPELMPTDIIPPHLAEEKTILDSEVPPTENDDDSQYDLSMIVDATKQRLGDATGTAMDLMAVQLDAGLPNIDDSAYTLSKEVDFKILEQDYEEELTQTQAVNEEIARAAVELAQRMQAEDEVLDVTAAMPSGDDTPAQNDADVDVDADTALNQELTLNDDITVEMDPKNKAG